MSPVQEPAASKARSIVPSSRGWPRRVLFAPGRVLLLAVLSLMELFGLPKIRPWAPTERPGDQTLQGVQ